VNIPLAQIALLAPAGNGQFSVFLTNGDRVTGSLVSKMMNFETKFGTLTVAAADISRLRSSIPSATVPATVSRKIRRAKGTSIRVPNVPAYDPPARTLGGFRKLRPK
jgi:hypothetical protein